MKNTGKSPLFHLLKKAFFFASESNKNEKETAEIIAEVEDAKWSRRQFLKQSSQAALFAGATGLLVSTTGCKPKYLRPSARIAIVGAGIAGLHALHILRKAGIENVTVYEASDRTGGRIFTAKDIFGAGLSTELGAELIDTNHTDMFNLAAEFGLEMLDLQSPSETMLIKDAFFFNGVHYSLAQVIAEFQPFASQIQADIDSLSDSITYINSSSIDKQLDSISISQYLTNIGMSGWMKSMLEVAYDTEFGIPADQQSAVSFLYMISTDTSAGAFEFFGESDERYKIKGGNQRVCDSLAQANSSHIETGMKLSALDKKGEKFCLYFNNSSKAKEFEYVILALPFTTLRNVDIRMELPVWKKKAITELGYGTNAKLMLGFTDRHWRDLGYLGYYFSDNGAELGWDSTQLQNGNVGAGSFTFFTGAQRGLDLGQGTALSQAQAYLPLLEQIYPGVSAKYTGVAERFHWPSHPFTLASYAAYRVGQWTNIAGAEQQNVGRLYFAGEHCSLDFQGYMNGGAETGRLAAEAILAEMEQ